MSLTPTTYDASKVIIAFAGGIITGYADGSFVTVERNEDSFKLYVGSAGEGARSRTNNRSGTITIKLMQTSPSNDVLSALFAQDEQFGAGIGPVSVTDLKGTTLAAAANSWVRKPPSGDFGREIGTRDWVLETDRLEVFYGGQVI